MSSVESIEQAHTAIVGSGVAISRQPNFLGDILQKISESMDMAKSIKTTLDTETAIQGMVARYVEQLSGELASDDAPHAREDDVVAKTDEIVERVRTSIQIVEEFIATLRGSTTILTAAAESCNATVAEIDIVADMLDEIGSA